MPQTTAALRKIEDQRHRLRLSQRKAAERAGMSEATWRQLTAGKVVQAGQVVTRTARVDQLLDMAAAVEVLEEVAELIGAGPDQVSDAAGRVRIVDPAEEEIMNSRHLSPAEKLVLLESLHAARNERP